MLKVLVRWTCIGIAMLLVVIQAWPYGRSHENPPVRMEPAWDNPQTRALAVRACYDCHSNETVWPWYSSIAPFSWLIQNDVNEGRRKLNFSEWDQQQRKAEESPKKVREWEMPPVYYAAFHRKAWLFGDKRAALIRGLEATFGGNVGVKRVAYGNWESPGS